MKALLLYILNFIFDIGIVLCFNYILLLGMRKLLLKILKRSIPGPPRAKTFGGRLDRLLVILFFWATFAGACVFMRAFVPHIAVTVIVFHLLYRLVDRGKIGIEWTVMVSAVLMTGMALIIIGGQPVLIASGGDFSADLWVYDKCNTLIELMLRLGNRLRMNTTGIWRLTGQVTWIQQNILAMLFLSVYVVCLWVVGPLARFFNPGTRWRPAHYYDVAPMRWFPIVAAAGIGLALECRISWPAVLVGGVYYVWGANLLCFLVPGRRHVVNVVIYAAGLLHPVAMICYVILGLSDNLLDIRRVVRLLRGGLTAGSEVAPTEFSGGEMR